MSIHFDTYGQIKKEIDDATLGLVPNDSITDEKLVSTGIKKTVADHSIKLADHDSQLAENTNQINQNTTNIAAHASEIAANAADINTQKSRIDNIVISASNYYNKCLSTDTGALLVVSNGATTGQINLADVTPKLDTYIPISGDYVRLVSNGLAAETTDIRIGADGVTYTSAGVAVRQQLSDMDLRNQFALKYGFKKNYSTQNLFEQGFYSSSGVATAGTNRIRTKDFLPTNITRVVAKDGYQFMIAQYDTSGNFLSRPTVFYTSAALASGYKYKLIFLKSDINADISVSEYINCGLFSDGDLNNYIKMTNPRIERLISDSVYQNNAIVTSGMEGFNIEIYNVKNASIAHVAYTAFSAYTNPYTLLDENMNVLSYKNIFVDGSVDDYIDVTKASYLAVTTYYTYTGLVTVEIDQFISDKKKSFWYGKKIVWFGTSIPAGGFKGSESIYSYPKFVGEMLGATVINEAIGSSPAHCQRASRVIADTNPYGFDENFIPASRCLSNSVAEMTWLTNWIDYKLNGGTYKNAGTFDSNVFSSGVNMPTTWASSDTSDSLSFSYENKLDKYLGDGNRPDLFVFDHGYNDRLLEESDYSDSDPYNKKTFKGAMNFLIARILSDNPYAKIVVITHYTDQNLQTYNPGLTQAQEDIAETWQLPCCQLYKKLGWSSKYTITTTKNWSNDCLVETGVSRQATVFSLWIADGLHPHSDKSNKALKYISEHLAAWLENEVRKIYFNS